MGKFKCCQSAISSSQHSYCAVLCNQKAFSSGHSHFPISMLCQHFAALASTPAPFEWHWQWEWAWRLGLMCFSSRMLSAVSWLKDCVAMVLVFRIQGFQRAVINEHNENKTRPRDKQLISQHFCPVFTIMVFHNAVNKSHSNHQNWNVKSLEISGEIQ